MITTLKHHLPRLFKGLTFGALLFCLFPMLLNAQALSSNAVGEHIKVALLANKQAAVPNERMYLGVMFSPDPQWHTYWRNPGDSGEAPKITWQANLPLSYGDIQWPIPKRIPVAHLVNYGYEGDNLLMVAVDIPSNAPLGQTLEITADISWLVCKEDCIPGWATLQLNIPIASSTQDSSAAPLFAATMGQLPQEQVVAGRFEINQQHMVFESPNKAAGNWLVFPFRSDVIVHAADQQVVFNSQGSTIIVPKSDYFNGQAQTLQWLLSNGETAFYVDGKPSDAIGSIAAQKDDTKVPRSLFIYVLMAFAGGLILNLMPCVLPILSIKAITLQNTRPVGSHKFAYFAGVLFCFNVFAALILLLQQGGQQVGWGFHMQEPVVVVILAFLFTYIGLVLLDAIGMSSRFAGMGQNLVEGNSRRAHFATGALAVIVASPCTAPFMAAALGVALVSSGFVTLVLFNALAVGFALPLTMLYFFPKALAFLPKPGQWMLTFKHFLAFPMFLTVAWLCWVYAGQVGSQLQFVLLVALIVFCMFAWLSGQAKKRIIKIISITGASLALVLSVWFAWYSPVSGGNDNNGNNNALVFNQSKLNELLNEQNVVVVNMTADWCITCKVNEQVAFDRQAVKDALQQQNVQYMVGDWTNKNQKILAYLTRYQRAGVPLYVVYAGNKSKQILPQILTPNMIINAIEQAKKELSNDESK